MSLDPRVYSTAVKAAIKAELGPNNAYNYGTAPGSDGNPGTLPDIFVLVAIERTSLPSARLSAEDTITGWRIDVRAVGRTVSETQWAMFRIATALNDRELALPDGATTLVKFESDDAPRRDDDDRYSATAFYRFAF